MEVTGTEHVSRAETKNMFTKLHLLLVWKELETLTPRIAVAIILSCAIGVGGFFLRVINDGKTLELTTQWPSPLANFNSMPKKRLGNLGATFEVYHLSFPGL